jgi:hypothetical protein
MCCGFEQRIGFLTERLFLLDLLLQGQSQWIWIQLHRNLMVIMSRRSCRAVGTPRTTGKATEASAFCKDLMKATVQQSECRSRAVLSSNSPKCKDDRAMMIQTKRQSSSIFVTAKDTWFEFLKWAFQWPVATAPDRPDGQVVPVPSASPRVLRSRATFLDDAEAVQLLPDPDRDDGQGDNLLDGLLSGEKPFRRIKFSNRRPESGEREVNCTGPYGEFGSPVWSKQ